MNFSLVKSGLIGAVFLCTLVVARAQVLLPIKSGNQWGYLDTRGQVIITPQYDFASEKINGVYRAKKGKKLVIIFSPGKVLSFDGASAFQILNTNNYKVLINKKWYLTDSTGTIVNEQGMDHISSMAANDTLVIFQLGSKKGLMDNHGKILIPARYYSLRGLNSDLFAVKIKTSNEIIVNSSGKVIGKDTFMSIYCIDINHRIFIGKKSNYLQTIFDTTGKEYFRGKSLEGSVFYNRFLRVNDGTKFHYFDLDSNGKALPKFDYAVSRVLPGIYLFTNSNSIEYLYHHLYGIVFSGYQINLDLINGLYRVSCTDYKKTKTTVAVLNNQFKKIPDHRLTDIIWAGPERVLYYRDSGLAAIYHTGNSTFETGFNYSFVNADSTFIKAYTSNGIMHLYDINANGTLTEPLIFNNAIYVAVNSKDKEFEKAEDWSAEVDATKPFLAASGKRKSNWFSITRNVRGIDGIQTKQYYGLYLINKNQKNDTVIKPSFADVRVLDTAPYSIGYYENIGAQNSFQVGRLINIMLSTQKVVINDGTGERITAPASWIDEAELINPVFGSFRLYNNNLFYLISKSTNKVLLRATYISTPTQNGTRRFYQKGGWNVVETDKITEPEESISPNDNFLRFLISNGLYSNILRTNRLTLAGYHWQLCNDGGVLINIMSAEKQEFSYLSEFKEGKAIFLSAYNKKYGVIDSTGTIIIESKYHIIKRDEKHPSYFSCGSLLERKGLIDNNGNLITGPKYVNIIPRGDIITGYSGDSMYMINTRGEEIYLGKGRKIVNFYDGYGFIKEKKGYKIIDENGNFMSDENFKTVLPFNNGYAQVRKGLYWSTIDHQGNEMHKGNFKAALGFQKTTGIFKVGKKAYFISLQGDKIKKPKGTSAVKEIVNGIFIYRYKNGRYRMFNEAGKKLFSKKFTEVPIVYKNFIIARSYNKTAHFFDLDGKWLRSLAMNPGNDLKREFIYEVFSQKRGKISTFKFSPAQLFAFAGDTSKEFMETSFPSQLIYSRKDNYHYTAFIHDVYLTGIAGSTYTFINGNGNTLFNSGFTYATPFKNNVALCSSNAKMGLLDINGYWVIDPKYDNLSAVNDSVYKYSLNYTWLMIDGGGKALNETPADFIKIENEIISMYLPEKVLYYNIDQNKFIWKE